MVLDTPLRQRTEYWSVDIRGGGVIAGLAQTERPQPQPENVTFNRKAPLIWKWEAGQWEILAGWGPGMTGTHGRHTTLRSAAFGGIDFVVTKSSLEGHKNFHLSQARQPAQIERRAASSFERFRWGTSMRSCQGGPLLGGADEEEGWETFPGKRERRGEECCNASHACVVVVCGEW